MAHPRTYPDIRPKVHDLTRLALIEHYEKRILILENQVQALRNMMRELIEEIKKI